MTDESTPGADREGSGTDRREFLGAVWGGMVAAGAVGGAGETPARGEEPPAEGDRRMIVRAERPLNLEAPPEALDSFLTPTHEIFVRSHHGAPATGQRPWSIRVEGLVERPLTLSLEDLAAFEKVEAPAVIQCAGNGRAMFRPKMPGQPWERGAVSHAAWSGVRLSDLLEKAGVKEGAAHVQFVGADVPPNPKAPEFLRSIPLERARAKDVVLALGVNGEPLPVLHGGPARIVVPGWFANAWSKWIRKIVVAADEATSFYMKPGYRIAKNPVPPGVEPPPEDMVPVTWMNVKSLITSPSTGATVGRGPVEVRGVAWTGEGHVVKVEVATVEDPTWREAELLDEPLQGSWRRFKLQWTPPAAGSFTLVARATDSRGEVQPETPPWNKSGYLWNGHDRVACVVS